MLILIYPFLLIITVPLSMLTSILEMCPFVNFGLIFDIFGFVLGLGSVGATIALTERFVLSANRD